MVLICFRFMSKLLLMALVLPSVLSAESFTFDFQHPDGNNSSFKDAVPVMTGCVKDRNKQAIGFMNPSYGMNKNYNVEALQLTKDGLEVTLDKTNKRFALSIKTNTTSASGKNPVKITCYLVGSKNDIQKQFEDGKLTLGVGWGPRSIKSPKALTGAKLWTSGKTVYITGQSGKINAINLPKPNLQYPFGVVWTGAKMHKNAQVYLNANNALFTNRPITDTKNILGNSEAYGYVYAELKGNLARKFTIKAIRFEGPNLAPGRQLRNYQALQDLEREKKVDHKTRYRGFNIISMEYGILDEVAKRWGGNMVRLEIIPWVLQRRWKMGQVEAWNNLIKKLPAYLDYAKKLGLIVVIDMHFQGKSLDGSGIKLDNYWENPKTLKYLKKLWLEIANVCKGRNEEIWFDLMNEPLDWNQFPKEPKNWRLWAQELINDIRQVNTKAWIVIEPGPGSHCWGFKDFPLLNDPAKRLIYSPHVYMPFDYTHQSIKGAEFYKNFSKGYKFKAYPGEFADAGSTVGPGKWDKNKLRREYAWVRAFQLKHNIRIWVGEFSSGAVVPGNEKYIQDCIDMFEEYGWDWAMHSLYENSFWDPNKLMMYKGKIIREKKFPTPLTERAKVVLKALSKNGRPQEPLKHKFK